VANARSGTDRRTRRTPDYHPERRVIRDRRRVHVGQGLEHGWVCFQSPGEKRRLAPPPPGWEHAPAEALEELLQAAAPTPSRDAG
jgi:hypothetical protein